MMECNVFEQTVQQTYFQRSVIGDGNVMLAAALGGYPNVRASLPGCFISQAFQSADKLGTIAVAGNLHDASTSSLTKCSRMILGRSASFSK